MPPRVIFPALAVIALVFGVAIGRWYVGTAVAVALWATFVLLYRRHQLRRSQR